MKTTRSLVTTAILLQFFVSAIGFAGEEKSPPSPLDRLDPARIPAALRLKQLPELVAVLDGKSSARLAAFALSKRGQLVASSYDGVIRRWALTGVQPAEHRPIHLPGPGRAASLNLSPDGTRLFCASDGAVRVFDLTLAKPKEIIAINAHPVPNPGMIVAIWTGLTIDGRRLASKGMHGPVRVWDVTGPKPREVAAIPTFFRHGNFMALAFSPDGKLLVGASTGKVLLLWDLTEAKPTELAPLAHSSMVSSVAFTSDSQWLATGCGDQNEGHIPKPAGEVLLWEVAALAIPRPAVLARHTSWINSVSLRPDGRVLASAGEDGQLVVWDLATGKIIREWKLPGSIECAAFAPDGRHLITGNENGTLYVLRLDLRLPPPPARTLRSHWDQLLSLDAAQAYSTILAMATDHEAVAFLKERLPPVPNPDPKRIAGLIADLNDDRFSVREAATQELKKIGPPVEPALREVLKGTASAETRRRVSEVVATLHSVQSVETLRRVRAIQVLERIASTEARKTLETLAQGAQQAHETRVATAALDRLTGKQPR